MMLYVPDCCDQCGFMKIYGSGYFCGNDQASRGLEMVDISAFFVDPSRRPFWCPIVKLNEQIAELPKDRQEALDNYCNALKTLFDICGAHNSIQE